MNKLKKALSISLALVTLAPSLVFAQEKDFGSAKNVIVMIPDGMSVEDVLDIDLDKLTEELY